VLYLYPITGFLQCAPFRFRFRSKNNNCNNKEMSVLTNNKNSVINKHTPYSITYVPLITKLVKGLKRTEGNILSHMM